MVHSDIYLLQEAELVEGRVRWRKSVIYVATKIRRNPIEQVKRQSTSKAAALSKDVEGELVVAVDNDDGERRSRRCCVRQ